jgi:hypothetical protein
MLFLIRRSVRLAAAALDGLLDGLFEHPAPVKPSFKIC